MGKSLSGRPFFFFLFFTVFLTSLFAAEPEAALSGKVSDEAGRSLPGVVAALHSDNFTKRVTTDKDGKFTLSAPPGKYELQLELPGFTTIKEAIEIPQAESTPLTFSMSLLPVQESLVVTGSKVETTVANSPATLSVINGNQIASSSAGNYADLLRTVPGLNAVQMSARDFNLTSRQATSTLADSQLALVDGRTVYQDFFGFVLWDLLPIDFSEIKQIEVVRGPASAVWGANALTGVVNIITKPPSEMLGTTFTLTGGVFDRGVTGGPDLGSGESFSANFLHAQKLTDNIAYKLSLSYVDQDPYARPAGTVPVDQQRGTGGAPYPAFTNKGTSQPKFDFRLDQDLQNGGKLSYSGGLGGTTGIIHSGIGPFQIQNKSYMGYGKVNYSKQDFKATFFTNILDGSAVNLLTVDPTGRPVHISFNSKSYDGEVNNSTVLGKEQILTYGGNVRHNDFDLSVAPLGKSRNEAGGFVEDDIFVNKFRFVIGTRLDKFSNLDKAVFSPRVTAMFKPVENHSLRVSFNRAFRSPSLVENFLNLPILGATLDLGLIDPRFQGVEFPIVTVVTGNPNLKQESLTAYEVGYSGDCKTSSWSATYYINNTNNNIDQINPPGAVYTADNPPPGWPLPPEVLTFLAAQGITFPSTFNYVNFGKVREKGVELSFDHQLNGWSSFYTNYSWQADPEVRGSNPIPVEDLNVPPHHRFNAGFYVNAQRYVGSIALNHTSKAFWADVLNAPFHGFTNPYTMVNIDFGWKWRQGKIITSLKVNNLLNQQIQQHIFGDVLKRSVTTELKWTL